MTDSKDPKAPQTPSTAGEETAPEPKPSSVYVSSDNPGPMPSPPPGAGEPKEALSSPAQQTGVAPESLPESPRDPRESVEPPQTAKPAGDKARPGSPATIGNPSYLAAGDTPWSIVRRILGARARSWYERAGQRITQRTLKIGISARIFHPEPGAKGLRGKTLQYLEESIAHWVMSRDVLVFMIPTVDTQGLLHPSHIRLHDYARHLDGLVLQGGADVSPHTYSETATRHEWQGDRMRDMYELELLHEFIDAGKPILGVCRGCQLINVAFGGTLYQDIATEIPQAIEHVNEQYEHNRHTLHFPDGSSLRSLFNGQVQPIVNSIHHQSIKTLGRDLAVEAVCEEDGVVEAVRYRKAPFVMGLQWHPEFHRAGGPEFLDCTPVLDSFLRAARETRF